MKRLWTAEEDAILREEYGQTRAADLAKRLGRSTTATRTRALRLGLDGGNRRWTPEEDRKIRQNWGDLPIGRIAQDLGRGKHGVYQRARALGLKLGAYDDRFETLRAAAKRSGFAYPTLLRILRLAGVEVTRSLAGHYTNERAGARIVNRFEVDSALRDFLQTSTVKEHARDLGMSEQRLRKLIRLARAAGVNVPPSGRKYKRWRIPRSVVDEALAWRALFETRRDAAERIGVSEATLAKRLAAAGLEPVAIGRATLLRRADVDLIK